MRVNTVVTATLSRTACVAVLLLAAHVLPAQTLTNFFTFDGTDGSAPAVMVQGANGNLYGVTRSGGTDIGTVFEITTAGKLTTLYNFCSEGPPSCPDGYAPAGLVLATNGNFYGTTQIGGAGHDGGTIFEITPAGKLTTLYTFCLETGCPDGSGPNTLIQGTNGILYGTTIGGGAHALSDGSGGTVFSFSLAGKLTTLYSFCAKTNCADGQNPEAALIQATNGDFYGTTSEAGAHVSPENRGGTVFRITTGGKLTTLYSFCALTNCADGSDSYAPLLQGANGNFYGTTQVGGANVAGGTGGTVFEITPAGKLTTLYSFCAVTSCTDGEQPVAGLMQATNGNLYGTTYAGGANNFGTIFEITNGTVTPMLETFDATNGAYPSAALMQYTNGTLYGTTATGCCDYGSIYTLSLGLGPFVETIPSSGVVGATIKILGNDLTETNAVTFNGTAATFKVVSATEITATVPTGATTGTVEVTTPVGTLSSNVAFTVK
jgi:uncharacterized repeat protein (TIGR03803 family)